MHERRSTGESAEVAAAAPALVVIGCSYGGADALRLLLSGLPPDFPLPLIVAQHRGAEPPDDTMVSLLQAATSLAVREADDKEPLRPGWVYVAPADYHLLVDVGQLALSIDPRVWSARPSVDMLFASAADAYGERVIALVLTGASADGASGAAWVRDRGGVVVVQDPETAAGRAMPAAALKAVGREGARVRVLPLVEMARFLMMRVWAARGA